MEINRSGVHFLLNLAKLIDFGFGVEISTIKGIQVVLYILSIQHMSWSPVSHDFQPLLMATLTKVQELGGRFRRSTRGQHSSQLRYAKKLRRKICLKAIFFARSRQVVHCFSLTGWFWIIQQVPKPDSLLRCNWACFLCGLKKAMTSNRRVRVS